MPDIFLQHQQLKRQFRELLDKASDNQAVLERFQQFELAMLAADSLADLLETLLFLSLRHFSLVDARIIWFAGADELCSLIPPAACQFLRTRFLPAGQASDIEHLCCGDCRPVLRKLDTGEAVKWFGPQTPVRSAAFTPLVCANLPLGCYVLGSDEEGRFSADMAVDFLMHMGLIAAVCIQNSANKERIRQLGMIDNLTQVKNRRCFDDDISKEVARAQRAGQPLSCLFLDADFFKAINDSFGHQAGDAVLSALASWIKLQLREGDHLARYGGEEFAVLLPQCDADLALQVAERIRYFVAQQTVGVADNDLHLTVSIGVTTFYGALYKRMPRDEVIKLLLRQADLAVYAAKQSGRNRVCMRTFDDHSF